MRIRTMLATLMGASAGAGAMYLLDPEHGPARRRELTRAAIARGRTEVTSVTRDIGARTGGRARFYAAQARAGFAEATAEPPAR